MSMLRHTNWAASSPMDSRRGPGRGRWLALLGAGLLGAAGCSTTAMKGTPFFNGEYTRREGVVEDRVNLWPLLYYREPAISVLWPIGEYADTMLAVRPFFSIEGLDQERRVYRVFWPLAEFDFQSRDHRIFPFFWGEEYLIGFPLYWHFDRPYARNGRGTDALWPLWTYFRNHEQYSLHLAWPFFNVKEYDAERGWRLWPLYGRYEQPLRQTGHAYGLWPLGWHTWTATKENWVLAPIFWRTVEPEGGTFGSLLGGWSRDGSRTHWFATPLLAWGTRGPDESTTRVLGGLAGARRTPSVRSSHVFPLYYARERAQDELFLSPIYASGKSRDGYGWRVLLPLGVQRTAPDRQSTFTLLYSWGTDKSRDRDWSCLLPLYYRARDPEERAWITPLGGWRTDSEDRSWVVYPLLSGGRRRDDGGELWIGGPLLHAEWDAAGTSHWLLPLYSYDHRDGDFLSLLYSGWKGADGERRALVPPLLSLYAEQRDRWDFWGLAGLAHFSGGETGGSSHLLPLYYANPGDETFVSPVYATWRNADGRVRLVPPLLSGWATEPHATEVLGLLGLFRARWGSVAGTRAGHLLPLYYFDRDALLTPLYGAWRQDDLTTRYYLTPLVGSRSGREEGSWLFPLYNHTREPARQASHGSFLLLGNYRREPEERHTGFPLLFDHQSWQREVPEPSGPQRGWKFNLLLAARMADYVENRQVRLAHATKSADTVPVELRRRENGLWPVWDYESETAVTGTWDRTTGNVLWRLFDYRHEVGRRPGDASPHDYTRRRVLWRLMHYERLNGSVSVDVFPAIAYDRDPARDLRKVAFLWRVFRYEREADRCAVDLLCVPVWRSDGGRK